MSGLADRPEETREATPVSDSMPAPGPARSNGPEPAPRRQVLTFRLDREHYGVDIADIVEILKYRPATPVPQASAMVHGIVSVRGRIITVVDGRRRLGLSEAPAGRATRIIVMRHGEESVGVLVDEVLQVERLPDDAVSAPPASLAAAAERGVAGVCDLRRDTLLVLLDRATFLSF
jgi:purine-binding chemotaxis protein CheW